VEFTSDSREVLVPYGEAVTVTATIRNDRAETMCFAVEAATSDERIAATPRVLSICVDANRTATVPVVVYCSSDAGPGSYFIEIALLSDGVSVSRTVNVVVDDDGSASGVE
jgi:uncharacterized membrane protein